MNKIESKFRSKIFRAVGYILGSFLVVMGIIDFAHPVPSTIIEKLGALAGILWGIIFLFFSVTGKNPIRTKVNNQKISED